MLRFLKKVFPWFFKKDKPVPTSRPRRSEGSILVKYDKEKEFADISHHRICEYSKFKGSDLIFKATEAVNHVDTHLFRNIHECETRGIKWGVYHFFRHGYEGKSQARHFVYTCKEYFNKAHHLPIIDFETNGKRQTREDLQGSMIDLLDFVEEVYRLTGRKCRVYSGDYLMGRLIFPNRLLEYTEAPWIANYNSEPKNFNIWNDIWAWQYTSTGNIDGVLKPCDVNRFRA